MTESKAYDDLIMDHIKNARNFRALADATHHANGSNPLCGDELTVYIRLGNERIEDAAFQRTCCGISMASASIMTESVRGKSGAALRIRARGQRIAGQRLCVGAHRSRRPVSARPAGRHENREHRGVRTHTGT